MPNVQIKQLNSTDLVTFKEMLNMFQVVFEITKPYHMNDEWLTSLLKRDSFVALVAVADDVVIGGLAAYIMQTYELKSSYVYVYDLAVAVEHQRQGIGTQLMQAIQDYSHSMGYAEVFVQADNVDQYALDFYTKIGGVAEYVTHFGFDTTK